MNNKKDPKARAITRPSSSDRLLDRLKKEKSVDSATNTSTLKVDDNVKRQRSQSIPRLFIRQFNKDKTDSNSSKLKVSDTTRNSDNELSSNIFI